jgi:hypothetical protein
MGQRYSVLVNIGDARLWQHRRLSHEEADIFVRAVFRAVPLSILRPAA